LPNIPRPAWRVYITAGQLNQNLETGLSNTRRLAVGSSPPGGFSLETHKWQKKHAPPGGYE